MKVSRRGRQLFPEQHKFPDYVRVKTYTVVRWRGNTGTHYGSFFLRQHAKGMLAQVKKNPHVADDKAINKIKAGIEVGENFVRKVVFDKLPFKHLVKVIK